MKNSISIKRLKLLSRIHLVSFLPAFIGVTAILIFVVFYITMVSGHDTDNYIIFFPFAYIFAGCIYTSALYGSWANKGRAFSYLTLPASITEKFVVGLFFTSVVFTVVFSLLYFGTAYVLGNIFHSSFTIKYLLYSDGNDNRVAAFSYIECFINYFIVQSLFVLGSIYFNKRQFNYSAIAAFLLTMLTIWVQLLLTEAFTGFRIYGQNSFLQLGGKLRVYNGTFSSITMNETIIVATYAFWIAIPLLIYYTAYLKLKEKEI
ncbi:MAG: hypothetical protein WCI92_04140 [Bacteroidota bacterium]